MNEPPSNDEESVDEYAEALDELRNEILLLEGEAIAHDAAPPLDPDEVRAVLGQGYVRDDVASVVTEDLMSMPIDGLASLNDDAAQAFRVSLTEAIEVRLSARRLRNGRIEPLLEAARIWKDCTLSEIASVIDKHVDSSVDSELLKEVEIGRRALSEDLDDVLAEWMVALDLDRELEATRRTFEAMGPTKAVGREAVYGSAAGSARSGEVEERLSQLELRIQKARGRIPDGT